LDSAIGSSPLLSGICFFYLSLIWTHVIHFLWVCLLFRVFSSRKARPTDISMAKTSGLSVPVENWFSACLSPRHWWIGVRPQFGSMHDTHAIARFVRRNMKYNMTSWTPNYADTHASRWLRGTFNYGSSVYASMTIDHASPLIEVRDKITAIDMWINHHWPWQLLSFRWMNVNRDCNNFTQLPGLIGLELWRVSCMLIGMVLETTNMMDQSYISCSATLYPLWTPFTSHGCGRDCALWCLRVQWDVSSGNCNPHCVGTTSYSTKIGNLVHLSYIILAGKYHCRSHRWPADGTGANEDTVRYAGNLSEICRGMVSRVRFYFPY